MTETLKPPERVPKGAQIYLVLGSHTPWSGRELSYLDRTLNRVTRTHPKGDIVAFVETAGTSDSSARLLEGISARRFSPSSSLAVAGFLLKHGRYPDLNNNNDLDESARLFTTTHDKFTLMEFAILDKHYERSGKRLRLLFESMPDEEAKKAAKRKRDTGDEFTENIKATALAVTAGNFRKGYRIFTKNTQMYAQETLIREPRLAEKIAAAALDKHVAAVVGYMGEGHTRLGHMLKRQGFTVFRTITGKEHGHLIYSGTSQAIRHQVFFPNRKLSRLEGYRLMIHDAIFGEASASAWEQEEKTGVATSDQELVQFSREAITAFSDMRSIRRFKRRIRSEGFVPALMKTIRR